MTIHYCYRTTNKLTGEFYIGKRTTAKFDNWFDDPYLGSGLRLNNAIKKHGKENFHKVILCYAETKEENSANEILFIADQWMDDNCYNIKAGGDGGCGKHSEKTKRKMSKTRKGKPKSEEHRRRMSEAQKGEKNHFYGKTHSEETRRKISEAAKVREARKRGQ